MPLPDTSHQPDEVTRKLLQIIQVLIKEVHPNRPLEQAVGLDSHFEKDLGLDSLARVELIVRAEKAFDVALPERTFADTITPRELLRAILSASGTRPDLVTDTSQVTTLAGTADIPIHAETLVDVLNWHAEHHPDRLHIQIYQDDDKGERLTYQQLRDGAAKLAASLQQQDLQPAEPVAIMLPTGTDYFYSFFGILMAGGIPVPIYPPARASQLEDHMLRHKHILTNCQARILITVAEAKQVVHLLKGQVPGLKNMITVDELMSLGGTPALPVIKANDIAFLQYTSGSTGNPKGVVLTHANLLANIRAMGHAVNASFDDVFVSWLPLYHDMGLIGAWLGSLYFAIQFVVMSPLTFLARPERWLWCIHRYRGTLSASPNFGYEYCLRRLDAKDLQGLDLSSWRAAFNGAEAISPETLEQFISTFAPYSFRQATMMPVYGLAESSVGLAFPPLDRGPLIDAVERETFMRTGQAKQVQKENKRALRFVSSGTPLAGHQVRVVDMDGRELPERRQGRLEFSGPSTTSGYYRNAEKTRELFHGEWLDSGDLAYIANGEVYITGRIKDVIIRAGRNIYPHELEEAIGNLPGIRSGRVAAFGSPDQETATERLIVLAETRSQGQDKQEQLRVSINTLATDLVGAPPDEIILAPPGTVLKTSSGKIRRAACRALYEHGEIDKGRRSTRWQIARLTMKSLLPRVQRFIDSLQEKLFVLYAFSIYALLSPVVWFAVTLLPGIHSRWHVIQKSSRLLASATATPVTVNGLENLPTDNQNFILVANHASYLDPYVLAAVIPGPYRFVAKAELGKSFLMRKPLENINTEFVERFDTSKSVNDSRRLADALKSGNSLMFFAEGTFTRIPGLTAFHPGAFILSAQTGVPILPVSIRGTRSILRDDEWFPRHGTIQVTVGKPVYPQDISMGAESDPWKIAMSLRNHTREFILRYCGEPDLT